MAAVIRLVRKAAWWVVVVGVAFGSPSLALAVSPAGVAHSASAEHGTSPMGKPASKPPQAQSPAQRQGGSAHGIVQSVAAGAVVVKELDGSAVSVPVGSSTHIFVDGSRGSLAAVVPGFVASASWKAGKAAAELLVFDPTARVAVVQSVSARALVVTDAAGKALTVRVTPRTRVLVDGEAAPLGSVMTGYTLVMQTSRPAGKPAAELRFLRPG
jgi:hypothetical protein